MGILLVVLLLTFPIAQPISDKPDGGIWRYAQASDGSEEEVIFPDSNLETVVRSQIGKRTGNIYPSDLQGLAGLAASNQGIFSISGLECCTNLSGLDLYENQISDISPLAGLTKLRHLGLTVLSISEMGHFLNRTLWHNQR